MAGPDSTVAEDRGSSSPPPARWMRDTLREGFRLLALGKCEEASECARRVLGAKRDLPEGHFLVGLIALELEDRFTAVQAFGSVTQLRPDHGAAWAQLARLFMRIGQTARADKALAKAIEHEDGNPTVHDLIGAVYSLLGDQEEALAWQAKAVSAQPDNPAFLASYANSQMYLGRLEQAEATLTDLLGRQPNHPNAHWMLAGLRKATDRRHVDEMRDLIATTSYVPQALAFMHYACGKELEDLEAWDEAFEAFAAGAAARRSVIDYDEPTEIEMYETLERLFTGDWLAAGPAGHDDPSPIFVVGQPRTGTTLVERVITAHSDVHSAGELRQFGSAVRRLSDYAGKTRFSAELMQQAAALAPKQIGEMYLRTSRKFRGTTPRFVDKLPSNFLYLPLILKALPNAKIVHLKRDPMDACFSSFKQLFADAYMHSYDQAEMARHHARYYRLMTIWRERFGDRFHEVRYEDIASDLETNARALIGFLELPWQDDCLDFHKQKTAVTTASAVQVRQPVHTKSIGRWKKYRRQLETMREVLQAEGVPLDE